MSTTSRLVRSSPRLLTYLRVLCHPSHTQFQAHKYDTLLFRPNTTSIRHMGIFKGFSDALKGELKNNPELQKSVEQFKEKAVDFRDRTKEATNQIYKQADGVGSYARQASAVVREQVNNAKGKVIGAAAQARESFTGFKFTGRREASESASVANAESSKNESSKVGPQWVFMRFQPFLSYVSAALDKVTGAKVFGLLRKGYYALLDELTVTSSKRRIKTNHSAAPTVERSTRTDLIPVVKKQTEWEKRWDSWKDKIRANPVYKRVRGVKEHPVIAKSQEIAEDIRERWETSDSPVVHKIQDLNDSLFGETATAVAVKEIRQRDPLFSFPDFLVEVQESTRPVLQAYLKGDLKELQKRCSREVVDRCRAERTAYESQGIFMDNKILHISDVEVKETKLLGNTPIIIVGFRTQQIYCVRDKHGKITQGAKDDIQTVFYAWAMQQVVPEDYQDGLLYPYWQLREMQQLGIKSII
ncbi:hypothetical protein GOP47_0015701 [Adiantum capillus-veneris]|uniref:Tim44-like domain-containing protein n=1 Tax=Adiantum capillus-veneris TaxID=13818 RepID=A0A9D4ZDG2_ADICA|nr:hypothetical protein GOP47_0015701 [Adiantum capillus-veneris]